MPKQLINIPFTFEYQYEELENDFYFYEIKPIQDQFNILKGGKIGVATKSVLEDFISKPNEESFININKSEQNIQRYIITQDLLQEIREDKGDLDIYIENAKKSLILLSEITTYDKYAEKLKNKEMEVIDFLKKNKTPIAIFDLSKDLLYFSNSITFKKVEEKNSQELKILKEIFIQKQKQYNIFEKESFSLFLKNIEKLIENKLKVVKNISKKTTPEGMLEMLRELDEMFHKYDPEIEIKGNCLLKINIEDSTIYKKIGNKVSKFYKIFTNQLINVNVLHDLMNLYLIRELNIDKKLEFNFKEYCQDILADSVMVDALIKEKNYDYLNDALSSNNKIDGQKLKL